MNSYQLHQAGVLDDATAIVVALMNDGWPADDARALVARHAASAAANAPKRHWQRWSPEELAALDEALDEASGKLPGVTVTRLLAARLGREHKAVVSALERRRLARGQ